MKIVRNFIYWPLIEANYNGHEVVFALTNNKKAEPIFELSNELNQDWKIILMPINEGTNPPTKKEFHGMEKYFWEEGYFEYLEKWYNYFNSYESRLTDEKLEKLLTKEKFETVNSWWNHDTMKEYDNDDER